MKTFKRILALCLVLALSFTVFGCSKENETTNSGITTLTMYVLGEKPVDFDLVVDEVNKKLEEDIQANVDVRWISFAEIDQKYPMILSSGEPFDLIIAGSSYGYTQYARKGSFMNLDELFEQNAPKSYANAKGQVLDSVKVDGSVYLVPSNIKSVAPHGYVVRGDLMKKYGMETIDSVEDFFEYCQHVVDDSDIDMIPFNTKADTFLRSAYLREKGWMSISNDMYWKVGDETYTLEYMYDLPEYEEFVKLMRKGYENHYWSEDVLANSTDSKDAFMNERSAASMLNLSNFNDFYMKVNAAHPEWDVKWFQFSNDVPYFIGQPGGVAIGANSKNPEKALQMLDLFKNDESYYMLTVYGIEGKHYTIDADGNLEQPEDQKKNPTYPPESGASWSWRDQNLFKTFKGGWPEYEKCKAHAEDTSIYSPFLGFSFNSDNVRTETAVMSEVVSQYELPLRWGVVEAEDGLKLLKDELEKIGKDKFIEEYKKQVAEYIKANN